MSADTSKLPSFLAELQRRRVIPHPNPQAPHDSNALKCVAWKFLTNSMGQKMHANFWLFIAI